MKYSCLMPERQTRGCGTPAPRGTLQGRRDGRHSRGSSLQPPCHDTQNTRQGCAAAFHPGGVSPRTKRIAFSVNWFSPGVGEATEKRTRSGSPTRLQVPARPDPRAPQLPRAAPLTMNAAVPHGRRCRSPIARPAPRAWLPPPGPARPRGPPARPARAASRGWVRQGRPAPPAALITRGAAAQHRCSPPRPALPGHARLRPAHASRLPGRPGSPALPGADPGPWRTTRTSHKLVCISRSLCQLSITSAGLGRSCIPHCHHSPLVSHTAASSPPRVPGSKPAVCLYRVPLLCLAETASVPVRTTRAAKTHQPLQQRRRNSSSVVLPIA